jgi:hypothetical protein
MLITLSCIVRFNGEESSTSAYRQPIPAGPRHAVVAASTTTPVQRMSGAAACVVNITERVPEYQCLQGVCEDLALGCVWANVCAPKRGDYNQFQHPRGTRIEQGIELLND